MQLSRRQNCTSRHLTIYSLHEQYVIKFISNVTQTFWGRYTEHCNKIWGLRGTTRYVGIIKKQADFVVVILNLGDLGTLWLSLGL